MKRARPRVALAGALLVLLVAACSAGAETDDIESGDQDLTFAGVRVTSWDKSMPEVDAIGYDVDFTLKDATPRREAFEATVKGTYVATARITKLDLDFVGSEITSVQALGKPATFTRSGGTLTINLPRPVEAGGTVTTTVVYRGSVLQADGNPRTDFVNYGGLVVQHAGRSGTIFSSLGWPAKTRNWIPVRDHPRDGAMVAMKATFPGALTVVANGAQKGAPRANANGTKTWEFICDKPLPIYDLHLAASDRWSERKLTAPETGVTVTAYTYKEHAEIANAIYGDQAVAVDYFSKTFGTYAWGKDVRYLEEPIFAGGMENATAISLDESLFTARGAAESRSTSFHELAHHWSGNLVRYRSWNDFWLSEGFTEYLTARFIETKDGAEAGATLWRDMTQRGLSAEDDNLHPIRPADPERDVLSFFDDIVYEKGAVVLRMLEQQIGREPFTAFMKTWFAKHAFAAMTTDDFMKELGAATGRDLKPFFDQWVYGQWHPELEAKVVRVDAGHVKVTVNQLQTKGPRSGFAVPVEVELERGATKTRVKIDMTSKTASQIIALDGDASAVTVDPDERLFATRICDTNTCPNALRCRSVGAHAVCQP